MMPSQNSGSQGNEKRDKEHENSFRRLKHKIFGTTPKNKNHGDEHDNPFESAADSVDHSAEVVPTEDQVPEEPQEPCKSFWEEAVAKVDPEIQDVLAQAKGVPDQLRKDARKTSSRPTSLASMVITGIEKRINELDSKEWALPFDTKIKKAKIKSLMSKVYKIAMVIKDNGDDIVGIDPTGYAKAGWIPFCIILNLTTSQIEESAAALDTFSLITLLIHQYESVEKVYKKRAKDNFFEKSLVSLYARILTCEAALIRHFERRGFIKFLRAIPAIDGWADIKEEIDGLDEQCRSFLQIADSEDIVDIWENTRELVDSKRQQETEKVLNWITKFNNAGRRITVIEKARLATNPDVGKWLFEDGVFDQWLSSTTYDNESEHSHTGVRTLWLHGPIGCGKSTFTTQVIEYFLRSAGNSSLGAHQIAYFYCLNGQLLGDTTTDILRSLVRQLCWSPKDSQIDQDFRDYYFKLPLPDSTQLSIEDCEDWLLKFFGHASATTIIIDALDECKESWDLLQAFKRLGPRLCEKNLSLKLFISSRDEIGVIIKNALPNQLYEITITDKKADDDLLNFITRNITEQCERYPTFALEEYSGLRRRLINELAEKGKLAFRWTELQLALFFPTNMHIFNPDDIEDRLIALKDRVGLHDLDQTYMEIYNRVPGKRAREHLAIALHWMLACKEPMSIHRLIEVLKFKTLRPAEPGLPNKSSSYVHRDYVLGLTSNFLILSGSEAVQTKCATAKEENQDGGKMHAFEHHNPEVVQFAHASVKEFFQTKAEFSDEFSDANANIQVSIDCLNYVMAPDLVFIDPWNFQINAERFTFQQYAFGYWISHCALAGSGRLENDTLRKPFEKLMLGESSTAALLTWAEQISRSDGHRLRSVTSMSPINFFLACAVGFTDILDALLQTQADTVTLSTEEGKTGLHIAAHFDQAEVLEWFLYPTKSRGVDVTTKDKIGRTALHDAAKEGNLKACQVLLSAADISTVINSQDLWSYTPLLSALSSTEGRLNTVKALLEHPDTTTGWKDTSLNNELHYAVQSSSDIQLVRLLLVKEAKKATGRHGECRASWGMVNALNMTVGNTPLHDAMAHSDVRVLSLLLGEPYIKISENDDGLTPFQLALDDEMWTAHRWGGWPDSECLAPDRIMAFLNADVKIPVDQLREALSKAKEYGPEFGTAEVIMALQERISSL